MVVEAEDGDGPRLKWTGKLPGTRNVAFFLVATHVILGIWAESRGLTGLWEGILGTRDVRVRTLLGGQYRPLVAQGEVWRLVTSGYVHASGLHLLINLVGLAVAGRIVEPLLGLWRTTAVFGLGLIGGSAMAQLAGAPHSNGASSGVFALLGVGVALGWTWTGLPEGDAKLLRRWLFLFVMFDLGISLGVPQLDVAAHAGGALTGVLLGWTLRPDGLRFPWMVPGMGVPIVALLSWWFLA